MRSLQPKSGAGKNCIFLRDNTLQMRSPGKIYRLPLFPRSQRTSSRVKWYCIEVLLSRTLPSDPSYVDTYTAQAPTRLLLLTQHYGIREGKLSREGLDVFALGKKFELYWTEVPSCETPTEAGGTSAGTLKCIHGKLLTGWLCWRGKQSHKRQCSVPSIV